MAGLIHKRFNQAVNQTAFSLALQSVRLALRQRPLLAQIRLNLKDPHAAQTDKL